MTHEQVLTKAIGKAVDNGWVGDLADTLYGFAVDDEVDLLDGDGRRNVYHLNAQDFIFNHDFAKALWGEEPCYLEGGRWECRELRCDTKNLLQIPYWKYQLTGMVMADDPIEYLGKTLH